jgi:manganese/zinc/iron transport system permease protein
MRPSTPARRYDVAKWAVHVGHAGITGPWGAGALALLALAGMPGVAQAQGVDSALRSDAFTWPSVEQIWQVLLLQDYNTRVVVIATMLLGAAAGVIGSFLLLRKRSLMGDVLSHATLPGVCLAFMAMVAMGLSGKALLGLLIGAAALSILGFGAVMAIRDLTRLKDDSAMGIVLSVTFGLGVALLGLAQDMPGGSAAGLESFIYGKTASIIWRDAVLIGVTAAGVAVLCGVFYKELTLLCFDDGFAASQGWPVRWLDVVMLLLVTAVTVIGLQSVGLILIIALLLIPPAAARFWSDHLPKMLIISALIGAGSGWLGASLSALVPRLPSGAIIVVAGAAFFLISMIVGPARGVVRRTMQHIRLSRNVARQHLLRALYEIREAGAANAPSVEVNQSSPGVAFEQLLTARSWSRLALLRLVRRLERRNLVRKTSDGRYRLTETGLGEAAKVVRNHRLWEIYLLSHADVAPNHVDRDADQIEHVLPGELIQRLETLLHTGQTAMPASPHTLATDSSARDE